MDHELELLFIRMSTPVLCKAFNKCKLCLTQGESKGFVVVVLKFIFIL